MLVAGATIAAVRVVTFSVAISVLRKLTDGCAKGKIGRGSRGLRLQKPPQLRAITLTTLLSPEVGRPLDRGRLYF